MNFKTFGLVTVLAIGVLVLVGCGKTETPVDENAELANPASVYCEENGGTLLLEEGAGLCMFPDGSYCEEWDCQRGECRPGEVMYNSISDVVYIDDVEIKVDWNGDSEIFSREDLQSAVDAIMNVVDNEWNVEVEMKELFYAGDETSTANLECCQSLDPKITECAVFTSNFHLPEQDVEMAGAFEPNADINGYGWTLRKNAAGEWEVLVMVLVNI